MTEIKVKKRLNAAGGEMFLDVDLRFPDQQLIGLYGKSGAGKTSLLRILAGLFTPDEAKVIVNGTSWIDTEKGISLSPQKRKVGLVFQDYALFPNMTVRENLTFALSKGQSSKIIEELIALSELGDLQHQRPAKLSGGQQQRVALARSLVQRPKLLLLDEPLSALDNEMRGKLQEYLLRVHLAYGLTTILISHDQEEIKKMADWVVILQEGKVLKQGTSKQVFPGIGQSTVLEFRGTLTQIEKHSRGYWLTLVAGENKWRVWSTGALSYTVGDQVVMKTTVGNIEVVKSNGGEKLTQRPQVGGTQPTSPATGAPPYSNES